MEKFGGGSQRPDDAAADRVTVRVDGEARTLDREAGVRLRAALGEALSSRREFVRTAGEHRPDGSYVVERRGAESAGHRKVFDSAGALRDRYDALPSTFTAADLERPGVSGRRRHLLAWHLAEHPGFDCELVSRQPLTVRKRNADREG